MINLLEFFENVADQNKIHIEKPMKRRVDEIKEFAKTFAHVYKGQDGYISELINDYKVKELIERVEKREKFENQLKLFDDFD